MLVNGKMMREMEKVHVHMLVVMYMMVNLKIIRNMEKVHVHMLVVMYMLVNGKMIRNMEKAKRLSQMVRSFTKECGNMINQFDEYIYAYIICRLTRKKTQILSFNSIDHESKST